jgi:hypothetical protein
VWSNCRQLYAKPMEAVESCSTLSASTLKLISILSNITSVAELRNCSQSVNFSSGS